VSSLPYCSLAGTVEGFGRETPYEFKEIRLCRRNCKN
jgi:hypothetical protein